MDLILDRRGMLERGPAEVGNKAWTLAVLADRGVDVPEGVCVPSAVYQAYIDTTGLGVRIWLELSRKPLANMRREEVWDASLRIRNLFLRTPLPTDLADGLAAGLSARFGDHAVVVRSSAPGEDSARASFAGLHESYVNVRGAPAIVDHVRRVWASLWSDGALFYRRELGIEAGGAMAVLVQELVAADCSGVAFSRGPVEPDHVLIEAVHGLNQGLVDGAVEPDRWRVERATARIVAHEPASARAHAFAPGASGVRRETLASGRVRRAPLRAGQVSRVAGLAMEAERIFGSPQDLEWSLAAERLYALQTRPVTAAGAVETWGRSLPRTIGTLKGLYGRITREIVPALLAEASDLARRDPAALADAALADEIERRIAAHSRWMEVYWSDMVPFAHGMRLFGQVYNDIVRPEDPHEFLQLLSLEDLSSAERDRELDALAARVRADPALEAALRDRDTARAGAAFLEQVSEFVRRHGDLSSPLGRPQADGGAPPARLLALLVELAGLPAQPARRSAAEVKALADAFLGRVSAERRPVVMELLSLARAGYRLRDDDNLYLKQIDLLMQAAVAEGRRRLMRRGAPGWETLDPANLQAALRDPAFRPAPAAEARPDAQRGALRARQLIGQPAGPGLATGPARVVRAHADLFGVKRGDVLVCDAISPAMTFVVPLVAAIVESRGGMLIHGAIVAREYGVPCVTGVEGATDLVRDGTTLTVDGYLGLIRVRDG